MATPTYGQVVRRWYAVACTGRGTYLRHPHMACELDRLTGADGAVMAEVVRERNGMVRCFLLNGDGGGSRTRFRNQQWEIRAVVQAQMFPHIILPFAALEAAQIERHTLSPIEVRPDQWITERTWYDGFDENEIEWDRGDGYYGTGKIHSRPELHFRREIKRWTRSGYVTLPQDENRPQ